jgi:hypothetical protein
MKFFITIFLFFIVSHVIGQDVIETKIDSLTTNKISLSEISFNFNPNGYNGGSIYHNPTKKDKRNVRRWKKLLYKKLNEDNFPQYYNLACSFWEVSELNNAKTMFLSIFNQPDKYFNDTYYYGGSGVISTDSSTSLGYGGFTYNHKNEACNYLTKIYIEQEKFDSALYFLDIAENKYPVTFTCGTGYYRQRNEQLFLRTTCYYGLKKYQEIIDLLLPYALESSQLDELVFAIKKLYSTDSIQKMLVTAEQTMKLIPIDTGVLECTKYDDNGICIDSVIYYPCHTTIELLDKELIIPIPNKNIKNGERLTKERMQKEFRESLFYKKLLRTEDEG